MHAAMQSSQDRANDADTGQEPFVFQLADRKHFHANSRLWFEQDEMRGSRLGQLLRRDSEIDLLTPRAYRMQTCQEASSSFSPSQTLECDLLVQRPPASSGAHSGASSNQRKPIIKIANFPWEITKDDFVEFLYEFPLDETKIHIPIDRSTGKTKNEAFVELRELADAEKCIATLNRRILKGRSVSVQSSSSTELFNTHFPFAIVEQNLFLTKEEINAILIICKNYKESTTPVIDLKVQKKLSTLAIESNSFTASTPTDNNEAPVPKNEYESMKEALEGEIKRLQAEVESLVGKIEKSTITP